MLVFIQNYHYEVHLKSTYTILIHVLILHKEKTDRIDENVWIILRFLKLGWGVLLTFTFIEQKLCSFRVRLSISWKISRYQVSSLHSGPFHENTFERKERVCYTTPKLKPSTKYVRTSWLGLEERFFSYAYKSSNMSRIRAVETSIFCT